MRLPLLLASAVLAAAHAAALDLDAIKASGVIKVIAQKDEAPEMFNVGAGEPGFEREIVEGFARLQGAKVQPVVVATSADRIPTLTRGAGDVIIGIVDTPERRLLVSFTSEVIPARHLVISHKPGPVIESVEQFRAQKVGVVANTSWAKAAIEAGVPADSMATFADRNVMLDALRDGRITASVMTISDFTLATKAYPGLQPGVFVGPATIAAFAVRKGDRQLLAALDAYLGNFRKSPSWSRLVVKYFGEQALSVLGRR
ncbi:MAG: substrate-binding periplasmic protein [Vicinamibacteria bacterium]